MNTPPPPIQAANPAPVQQGDSTGGVIPYKNPHALIAYYLAVFSIIPVLGFVLGAVAVGLGISGLKQRARNPVIRGSVHAWFGIIAGGLSVLVHLFFVAMIVIAATRRH